jgi:hypothetical protein
MESLFCDVRPGEVPAIDLPIGRFKRMHKALSIMHIQIGERDNSEPLAGTVATISDARNDVFLNVSSMPRDHCPGLTEVVGRAVGRIPIGRRGMSNAPHELDFFQFYTRFLSNW